MREKHRSAASCTSPMGDVPATKVHALDQNRTWNPSVLRQTLCPLSQTGFSYFIHFLQRGRERDRELETSMRENHRSPASCIPPTGDVPATKVHALAQSRAQDLSVSRPTLYPLSQTSFSTHVYFSLSFFLAFIGVTLANKITVFFWRIRQPPNFTVKTQVWAYIRCIILSPHFQGNTSSFFNRRPL